MRTFTFRLLRVIRYKPATIAMLPIAASFVVVRGLGVATINTRIIAFRLWLLNPNSLETLALVETEPYEARIHFVHPNPGL